MFRIVKGNHIAVGDLLSHHETGKLPRAEPCLRCGLSVFRVMGDALNQQKLLPQLGKGIAQALLEAAHGKACLTKGQQPTHTTWWPYEGGGSGRAVRRRSGTGMMWEITGRPIDPQRFAPFEPLRVLNYYDGPRIFTFHDADGAPCLACWSAEDETHSRFLVVAVTDRIVADLEAGLLSVSEALAQPRLWVVDWAQDGRLTGAWLVAHGDVPTDSQPRPRTMLHRSLDPILSLRATGEAIRPGEIPGSVIRSTVEWAQRAIKCLAEYETDLPARRGRPSRALQKLYDLPVQKTLAASFEVQFRSPLSEPDLFEGLGENEIREEREVLNRVADHLKAGLTWLTTTPAEASALPVPGDPELSRAIIRALKFLTPSPRGPIREMEIRGPLATQSFEPIRLSRRARSILNGALSRVPATKERRVELKGRIRELNERLMRFELHPVTPPPATVRVCEFRPDLWDDVYEMLGVEETVDVFGFESGPTSTVRVSDVIRHDTAETI